MADVIQFKIGVTFGDLTQIVIFLSVLCIQTSGKNVSGQQLRLREVGRIGSYFGEKLLDE